MKACDLIKNHDLMTQIISEVTTTPRDEVAQKLRNEFLHPGGSVTNAFRSMKIKPHLAGPDMDRFYAGTDAFLFETTIWNLNLVKRRMIQWIVRHLGEYARSLRKPSLDILMIGDGMGFDSVRMASAGHQVTYTELPGLQIDFAKKYFEITGKSGIEIFTDPSLLEGRQFDVVIALDVLEHVPDPPLFVKMMADYLRPNGRLISHAPFYMIHSSYLTHLKSNRRHSGSLRLYQDAGLHLIDGNLFWNPISLGKENGQQRSNPMKRILLRLSGIYLSIGKITTLAFHPFHWYRCAKNRWFQ